MGASEAYIDARMDVGLWCGYAWQSWEEAENHQAHSDAAASDAVDASIAMMIPGGTDHFRRN